MSIMPPALVQGAPRAPRPFGLFSVIAPRSGSADRWEGGTVESLGLGCAPSGTEGLILGEIDCEAPAGGVSRDFTAHETTSTATAFTVFQSEKCGPIGRGLERSQEIARERLDLFEEILVERALWTLLGTATEGVGVYDIDTDSFGGLRNGVLEAVALIEADQAAIYGTPGVLHMPRALAVAGIKEKALEARNGRLFTSLGTQVVAGWGYAQEAQRIYWTPQLFAYSGEVSTFSNTPGDLLDRRTNDLYGIAERQWLIGFEQCGDWDAQTLSPETGGGLSPEDEARLATLEEVSESQGGEISGLSSTVDGLVTSVGTLSTSVGEIDTALDSKVESVVAGDGITVDDSDPLNPTVSLA